MKTETIDTILKDKINKNQTFIDTINQILHNQGVGYDTRYKIVSDILKKEPDLYHKYRDHVPQKVIDDIGSILFKTTINKNEIFQIIFMYFGNKHFKKELDQFYTPTTICNFISGLLCPHKTIIDPACGTGDLISGYMKANKKTFCDISSEVLQLTQFIHHNNNSEIIECNSLKYFTIVNPQVKFDYCVMNPPFGNKTVVDDKEILQHYHMGTHCEKQEIGILFVELGLKLIKKNGFFFVIVPNGYLGNCSKTFIKLRRFIIENYRLIAVIELPDGSFSRSGTGVSTSILIIKNEKCHTDYPIFVSQAQKIGYILNKKNTPFKYKTDQYGKYIYNDNKDPIIDNDLDNIYISFQSFLRKNDIMGLDIKDEKDEYDFFMKSAMDERYIIDVKRYLSVYKNIINNSQLKGHKRIRDYCVADTSYCFMKKPDFVYEYIDISSVSSPLYKKTPYNSRDLPSRAKHKVAKGDLLVSKLKGAISFTLITEDQENLIASNGFCVLRPKDNLSRVLLFANLFSSSFRVQHQSLATGSIMENISNEDILNIYVEPINDIQKFTNIVDTIYTLNNELSKIRN